METHNVKCDQCPEVFKSKEMVLEHKGTNQKEDVENESIDDDSDDPEVLVEEIEMLEDIVNSEEDSDAPVPAWESLADTDKTKSILSQRWKRRRSLIMSSVINVQKCSNQRKR